MALLVKDVEEKEYVQIPNETAKAVEEKDNDNPVSLEALGLLVNLWSYDITKWEIHKTELYQRFAKNKKTSVSNTWDELVKANYIIEFKYRVGRKWEYVYIYRIRPYSEAEKEMKLLECVELAGVESTSDFQHLKLNSSKSTAQNTHISNTKLKKDKINKDKELVNKELENLSEKDFDKKQELKPSIQNYRVEPEKEYQSDYYGTEPYGIFLENVANEFYTKFSTGRWNKKQWTNLIGRLAMDIVKGNHGVIENHRGYIHNCLQNIAYRHDIKHGKIESRTPTNDLPLYDYWLDDLDDLDK
jgi:hypothetical protein